MLSSVPGNTVDDTIKSITHPVHKQFFSRFPVLSHDDAFAGFIFPVGVTTAKTAAA